MISAGDLFDLKKFCVRNQLFLPSLFVLAMLSACTPYHPGVYISFTGPTQGTSYTVTYESADSINYQEAVDSLLHRFDMSLSAYQPLSIISQINADVPGVKPDSLFISVFNAAATIWKESEGSFDITVAPVINAWGFGFTEAAEVDSAMIDSLLQYVGMEMVSLEDGFIVKEKKGMMFDVNAIAQGYAVDVLAAFLEEQGVKNYLVEIGGEVRTLGRNSRGQDWRVGIDKPIEGLQLPGVQIEAIIGLSGKALATSGNYRRFYEKDGIKYSHTIDPYTGYPVQHNLLSATVLADDGMTADGFATAFMVMGVEKSISLLERRPDLDACLIYNDDSGAYKVYYTRGMKKRLVNNH